MTRILLWGSSEHASDDDDARLVSRLVAMGSSVESRRRTDPPDPATSIVVVNTKRSIGIAELDAMPRLGHVITTTSGYDHVDLAACEARNVRVARCPFSRRDAVVETAVAMGTALLRRLPEWNDQARSGRWVRSEVKTQAMPSLRGLGVGVIGHGVIGARAVEMFRSLGADVKVCDPAKDGLDPAEDVLAHARILSLHCSLTESSNRMIDRDAIAKLPRGAIVLNTARGECVDLDALISALDAGRIGGLGLDVFVREPPPELASLATRRNVLVTPHSAGYFDGLARAIEDEVVATVNAILTGSPLASPVAMRSSARSE